MAARSWVVATGLGVATAIVRFAVASTDAPPSVQPPSVVGLPRADLTARERARFEAGRVLFEKVFDEASGLGPEFNSVSCASCHYLPAVGGSGDLDHGQRILLDDRPDADPAARCIFLHKSALPGRPQPFEPPPHRGAVRLKAPPLFGLGAFEKIAREEFEFSCGFSSEDRVHGHANHKADGTVGKFGHVALQPDLLLFTQSALVDEMGITSPMQDPRRGTDTDAVPDPEVSLETAKLITAYVRGLAPPARDGTHPEGEALFQRVGCAVCHRPDPSPAARGAYTDLCVHSLGLELAHGIFEHSVDIDEWRTAPLWGLRLRQRYLHDDRAASLDEAIRMHGGEASTATARYRSLSEADRASLVAFLKTL
jgi:CxxC motif-containing protein (DUF1111 family)